MMPVYAIPIGKDWLLSSPWQKIFALINKNALSRMVPKLDSAAAAFKEDDGLTEMSSLLNETEPDRPEAPEGDLQPAFFGIITTRSCNMSCGYCDFGSDTASGDKMSVSLAVDAVNWIAEFVREKGWPLMEIHFFGGEPFLGLDALEAAVHRARMLADQMGIHLHLEISTNGYMDEKTARFAGNYFDAIVLSLDGFREDHDRNRPVRADKKSFQTVLKTVEHLSKSSTELCLRCCITKDTVKKMEDFTHWFCTEFQPSVINFETVSPNPKSELNRLYPPDPYEFAQNCIRSRRIAAYYGIPMVYASAVTDSPRTSFCPVGRDTLILSPDGRINACYLVETDWVSQGMDMNVGTFKEKGLVDIRMDDIRRLRKFVTQKPECEHCFCRWNCAGGCHVKHDALSFKRESDDYCLQTRLITAGFLLDDMGLDKTTDSLINSRKNMKILALNKRDLIAKREFPTVSE